MERNQIIDKIKKADISKVKFAVADIDGILRGKYIHKEKFMEAAETGIGFCDVIFGWDSNDACYNQTELTGWHTGYPDAQVKIDISTYREIPWENSIPFFLADFSESHEKYEAVCPRSLLKRTAAWCESMGFKANFALETEWFNFRGNPAELDLSNAQQLQPVSPGMFGYSLLRTSLNSNYIAELFDLLKQFDVPLEGLHTETGPGVYEAAIVYDNILAAADKAALFKASVKEIAYRHNVIATFMAKWNTKLPGCGGHIHQSLWDKNTDSNLFFENSGNGLSKTMEQYIAGQLHCLPEIMPMFAPTVNSYKRIGHGDWAPATCTWGFDNRTAAIRVIQGSNKSARIEFRVPGSDLNPYLAMAASLASGLYGIKNELKLTVSESKGNAYGSAGNKLPGSLREATENMKNSAIARELFGDVFVNHFTQTREWEWQQFSTEVTDWELKRYFEII